MEKFNVQVNAILLSLQGKVGEIFGQSSVDRKTLLALAKDLGYLEGKRGREGGTFATDMGMAFANLSGEIIRPVKKTKATKVSTPVVDETTEAPHELTLSEVA